MEKQLMDDLQPSHEMKVQFLVEEYQALRREIEVRMKNAFWIFLTTLPIIGSAYLFFFQNPGKILLRVFFFLPIIYLLLIAKMFFMMLGEIKDIGQYIMKIEKILSPTGFGWETHLHNQNNERLNKKPLIGRFRFQYHFLPLYYSWWWLLILGSTFISFVLYMNKQ